MHISKKYIPPEVLEAEIEVAGAGSKLVTTTEEGRPDWESDTTLVLTVANAVSGTGDEL